MAKAMIVFEDVNPDTNDGKPVHISFVSDRAGDCQDEPTVGIAAASAFYELMVSWINGKEDDAQE